MIWGSSDVCCWKGPVSVSRAIIHTTKKGKRLEIRQILLGPADSWLSSSERLELWKMQLKVRHYGGQAWQEANTLRLKGSLAKGTLWTEMFIRYQIQAAWVYKRSDYLEILQSEMKNANEEHLHYTATPRRRRITQ